jgi:sugar/nucleoside kinase (ribokinase family)
VANSTDERGPAPGAEWDVIGTGAACVDYVCRLPVFPKPDSASSKVRMHGQSRLCGGQTATALATCARLGLRTKYVGAVGADDDGRRILTELSGRGIDVADVLTLEVPTATATILIDDSGERLVLWYRDRGLSVPPARMPAAAIARARLVHVDDVDQPAAIAAASAARRAGIPVTCDIDHLTPRTEELLALVSDPVFAEQVPLDLTGETDEARALEALFRRFQVPVVVTLGEHGAMAFDGREVIVVPAFRIDPIDTTGAGDVFRAGFIYGLLQGWPLPQRIRFANACAAVSCTKHGAMGGVPSMDEVHALLGG